MKASLRQNQTPSLRARTAALAAVNAELARGPDEDRRQRLEAQQDLLRNKVLSEVEVGDINHQIAQASRKAGLGDKAYIGADAYAKAEAEISPVLLGKVKLGVFTSPKAVLQVSTSDVQANELRLTRVTNEEVDAFLQVFDQLSRDDKNIIADKMRDVDTGLGLGPKQTNLFKTFATLVPIAGIIAMYCSGKGPALAVAISGVMSMLMHNVTQDDARTQVELKHLERDLVKMMAELQPKLAQEAAVAT